MWGAMSDQGDFNGCFDAVPGALCLITADSEERVAFVNREALALYQCDDRAAFDRLTGGRFRGMAVDGFAKSLSARLRSDDAEAEASDYRYLSFSLRGARGILCRWRARPSA